jgi:hypothetical protein
VAVNVHCGENAEHAQVESSRHAAYNGHRTLLEEMAHRGSP